MHTAGIRKENKEKDLTILENWFVLALDSDSIEVFEQAIL